MIPPAIIIFVIGAFIAAAALTRYFCNPNPIVYMLDEPNARSLHDRPIPRGGLAILIAVFIWGGAMVWLFPEPKITAIALAMLIVSVISFFDDRYSVPPYYRFLAHAIAAAVILYNGFALERFEIADIGFSWSYAAAVIFSSLFIVWMINLYNFMDGMDGFAGGMTVFGFGSFAALGWMAGHPLFLGISLIIVAATAGFLIFNFPPARIFMGDIGSSTLGLLAATLSLWGTRDGVFPFWIALLVFSPFIVDATVTLFRRLRRREKIWQAHKNHYYQQLVQAGWGHRKTVLLEYSFMLGCGASALWLVHASATAQLVLLGVWIFLYVLFFVWVSRIASQRRSVMSKT